MRFIEILDGPQQQINNEECVVVDKIREGFPMPKKSLDEREQEVARALTTRGVLKRFKIDNEIHYKLNSTYKIEELNG